MESVERNAPKCQGKVNGLHSWVFERQNTADNSKYYSCSECKMSKACADKCLKAKCNGCVRKAGQQWW